MSRDFVRQCDRDPQESATPPSSTISNRKSGIRNPNNRCVFNRFHFSNRKYLTIFRELRSPNLQPPHSNRDTAIKTPDKPRLFSRFQFSNRYKMPVLHLEISESASFPASPLPRFSLFRSSESPCQVLVAHHSSLITHHSLRLRGQSLR